LFGLHNSLRAAAYGNFATLFALKSRIHVSHDKRAYVEKTASPGTLLRDSVQELNIEGNG
jgi:hypothetical protein